MKGKRRAFNLAEVLITLGIIGVVAAYTIPTIIANVTQTQNIVAWKKAYSTIDNAQRAIANDNGGDLTAGFGPIKSNAGNIFRDGWIPYLRVIKKCNYGKSKSNGCYSGTFKALTDNYTVVDYPSMGEVSSLVMSDGTVLFFYPGYGSETSEVFSSDSHIYIDVNGSKSPNRVGKDIFDMQYNTSKHIFLPRNSSSCSGDGWNCGAYYLTR